MTERGRARLRVVGALALVALIALVVWQVTRLSVDEVRGLLESAGPWAPLLYVLSFALLEPFGVFGIFFVGPGSLLWEWPRLFLLSWAGATGAGVVGFAFARFVARESVRSRIPAGLRAYEERLERSPFVGVIVVRLIFFLWPPAHWLLGLSRIRFGPFLAGTVIGFAPGIAIFTWLGKSIIEEVMDLPPTLALAVAGALLVGLWFRRWLRSRRREQPAA